MGTSALCRAHVWHTALLTSRQEKGKKIVRQLVVIDGRERCHDEAQTSGNRLYFQ